MTLVYATVPSESLRYDTELTILLPTQLDLLTNIKLCICLHGLGGSNKDFEHYNLQKYCDKYGYIFVFPNAHNSYYLNNLHGELFENFIGIEVQSIINNLFDINLVSKTIIGISMGGYGAVRIGLKYDFNHIVNLSGSVLLDKRIDNTNDGRFHNLLNSFEKDHDILQLLKIKRPDKLFSYCGENDFLFEDNKVFEEALITNQIECLIVHDEGTHNFDAWYNQMDGIFTYFDGEE